MKYLNALIYPILLFWGISLIVACSDNKPKYPPFWDEVQNFKKADSLHSPPQNVILFVGSSSFRLWKDLESEFKEYRVINRGFGGSNLIDANYYAKDIIFPYNPRQIVIYSGENDLPADTVNSKMLLDRFKTFFTTIRAKMPNVPIAYISIKPSPAREKYLPLIKESNLLIKEYLAKQSNTDFIDVYSLMLTKDGRLRPELYGDDNLHMNKLGYEIWAKAITPHLIKE